MRSGSITSSTRSAIAGLGIRDIMRYCVVALLWSGAVIGIAMLLL